jgi:signal transduction histidine kinase
MFSYPFMVRALLAGSLIALCASLLGVSLVLKRYSMIGDGLSHVGFGALAVATAMNAAPLAVAIPVVVLAAFGLLRLNENSKIKEIGELNRSFNAMTDDLGATEVLQSDFVSNVSHEIKTPLNAIEGYATLLQDSDSTEEERRRYTEKILFNTRRLSELVGNVLIISKLESGAVDVSEKTFRLDEQIRESLMLLEPKWVEKDIEFDVDLDEIIFTGDKNLLCHVWNNLIGNAVKFSPSGGLVTLRLEDRPDRVTFSISDCGPGIGETAKKHIFDKFYQEDNSHKQEGNGLGLSLVKRILDMSEDKIQVENLPDAGCKFTVTLKKR